MEEGDAIVAYSESQDCIDDDYRLAIDHDAIRNQLFERPDELSDIYHDRSYQNIDDLSI